MIALHDHIHELRAELAGCVMSRSERASVQAELAEALVRHAALERLLDDLIETGCE